MIDRALFRFGVVGMGNTVLGLGVIFLARQFCGEVVSNLIGYLVVTPMSFMAHRGISFRDSGSRRRAFPRYLLTILAGYLANFGVLTLALSIGSNGYLAQTAAIGAHVIVTYALSRCFVFVSPSF